MICIPIMARDTGDALKRMTRADALGDLIEIRLDVMEAFDLRRILGAATKPVLVTYRSRREGGQGSARYGTRVGYLRDAVEAGADFVDVEYKIPLEHRYGLFQHRGASKIIVSLHLRNGTPSRESLQGLLRKMAATGADMVKIVTLATDWEDNLRILELIPRAQDLGIEIIAFCMGALGRVSRIFSLLMGGQMTFASLEKGEESASGQIPALDMKRILEALSP